MYSIPIDDTNNAVFVLSNWLSNALVVSRHEVGWSTFERLIPTTGVALQSNLSGIPGPYMDLDVLPLPDARRVGGSVRWVLF